MAFSSCGNISFENKTDSDIDFNRSLEESTRGNQSLNCSDTDDECKALDRSFCESDDTVFQYEPNEGSVHPKKQGKQRGLAFLRRKWTVPEILTTCALFFEVFGWVRIIQLCDFNFSLQVSMQYLHSILIERYKNE